MCDAMFFFGQNPGTNSPRFLHPLAGGRASAAAEIVTFNPLRERGLLEFVNPQNPGEMTPGARRREIADCSTTRSGRAATSRR